MPSTKKTALFISYDGMTDPLGQSQVLPYVFGISDNSDYEITLLSCEKKTRFDKSKNLIKGLCDAHFVDWKPLVFHTSPPILSKYYDLFALKQKAIALHKIKNFEIVHCRSYLAIEVGLYLKRKFGCKVIFDMRGFWVDERVDGGLWNKSNPFYKFAYHWYKKKENKFIHTADHIISLTEAAKTEMTNWSGYNSDVPVTVIPCSADLELFSLTTSEQKKKAKEKLGYLEQDFVVSYLGSLGTWYMLDEMLDFFQELQKTYTTAKFLFVTAESEQFVINKVLAKGLDINDFQVLFAERNQVADFMKVSDISLSFIKSAYSKLASSPTKLGELLAMGIPVVCNSKIGDVERIIDLSNGGIVFDAFNIESYKKSIARVPDLLKREPAIIRANICDYYSLTNAIQSYVKVYQSII